MDSQTEEHVAMLNGLGLFEALPVCKNMAVHLFTASRKSLVLHTCRAWFEASFCVDTSKDGQNLEPIGAHHIVYMYSSLNHANIATVSIV